MTYGAMKMVLSRLAKKTIGKKVTPRIMRHTSATHYANIIRTRYQFCSRYGWTMSSNMPDIYLDREGIFEKETAQAVKTDEIAAANRINQNLSAELSLVKESNLRFTRNLKKLEQEIAEIKAGKGFMTILLKIANQQKQMSDVIHKLTGQKFDVILPTGLERKRQRP